MAQLVVRLAAQDWWGEIVGPHGSGKSTLVETLKPALAAVGCHLLAVNLRDGQRNLPSGFWHAMRRDRITPQICEIAGSSTTPARQKCKPLVIVDGYEQLGRIARWRLKRGCCAAGAGLVVTSHASTGLPELVRLAPDRILIEQLVDELCAQLSVKIAAEDLAASHACHGSNVREMFFELYQRYERQRRREGTTAGNVA